MKTTDIDLNMTETGRTEIAHVAMAAELIEQLGEAGLEVSDGFIVLAAAILMLNEAGLFSNECEPDDGQLMFSSYDDDYEVQLRKRIKAKH